MVIKEVTIKNYRSIESISFDLKPLDDESITHGLIGVNEVGKSSILKALALKEGEIKPTKKDFNDRTKLIEVIYKYKLSSDEITELKNSLSETPETPQTLDIPFDEVLLKISFSYEAPETKNESLEIVGWDNEEKSKVEEHLKSILVTKMHKAIFWTAEDKYLISQPINLGTFAANPADVSVPLRNCFILSGFPNIQEEVVNTTVSTDREYLQNTLGEKVTEHIKTVWPNHPIEITFNISDGLINFHVQDVDAKGKSKSRAKTADQRSDGFKQFISFLLTISAQNRNDELSNAILLLDEPETHLHPQAQEFLLEELIKITKNKRNNIVFFATHSNYMIDKNDLSRNYRIKKDNDKTEKLQFDKKTSTYASVSYEVFDIPSTDFHNELYGILHSRYIEAATDDAEEEKRSKITNFDQNILKDISIKKNWTRSNGKEDKDVSLCTYIRNYIHHPEVRDKNKKYTDKELKESIESMKKLV